MSARARASASKSASKGPASGQGQRAPRDVGKGRRLAAKLQATAPELFEQSSSSKAPPAVAPKQLQKELDRKERQIERTADALQTLEQRKVEAEKFARQAEEKQRLDC